MAHPPAHPTTGASVDAGGRGALEVADRAVQRIAQAAAREVPGVATGEDASSGALGALGSALGRDHPRVDCQVAGRRVRVAVEITTVWPHPAAQVAAGVRDHVTERLRTLADLEVDGMEVTVAKVVRSSSPTKRRVQ